MNFQLSGEVLRVLPVERGTTKNGYPFQKQTIVVRCFDKEQHVVALDLRGSRVDEYDYLKQGSRITAFFEIDSRSWVDHSRLFGCDSCSECRNGIGETCLMKSNNIHVSLGKN